MSSRRPTPAFVRDTASTAPYGKTCSAFFVVYQLDGMMHEEVLKPQSNQSVKQLMARLGVGPDDWAAEPLG